MHDPAIFVFFGDCDTSLCISLFQENDENDIFFFFAIFEFANQINNSTEMGEEADLKERDCSVFFCN
jgi:hypothetical protein